MFYLRQATSAAVMLGPFTNASGVFVDSLGTALTNSVVILSKNGAAWVAKNNTTTGSQRTINALSTGYYSVMLDSTDTNAVGHLVVTTTSLAALPVWDQYTVLAPNVYDYTYVGSSQLYQMYRAGELAVDMSSITAAIAARSPINALRVLRNRITTSGGIFSAFLEDDVTAVFTSTLTTNASADPIVESNPS